MLICNPFQPDRILLITSKLTHNPTNQANRHVQAKPARSSVPLAAPSHSHAASLELSRFKMQPTRPQKSIINELTGHASLLLSNTTPTIINSSPLQASTNNSCAQANSNHSNANSTPVENLSDDDVIPEDNINFKKPQNEIFKKLDGKIQKIVAAHSNLNKLYALNDFSSAGPRKPFELPPQLPRPPPWVPKVSSDYGCSQWAEETLDNLNRTQPMDAEDDNARPRLSVPGSNRVTKLGPQLELREVSGSKQPPPTLDSAISRLHQRRQLLQNPQLQKVLLKPQNKPQATQPKFSVPQPQPRISQQAQRIHQLNIRPPHDASPSAARELFPGTSRSNNNLAQFSSKDIGALTALLKAQKQLQQSSPPKEQSTGPTSIKPNLTPEERRKFQMELINIFRQEIAAVTKLAKLKFQSPQRPDLQKISDQNSLLLKKSPQSLFNTIRRETSLLLNRKEPNRSGTSLLSEQQSSERFSSGQQHAFRPTFNRYQSIKVVVPPTEHFKHVCGKQPDGKEGIENSVCKCFESKAQNLDMDEWCPSQHFTIEYRSLQTKLYQLKYVQRKDEYNRSRGIAVSMLPADARRRANNPQKSLDNIVGRLQAKCMSSTSSSPVNQDSHDQSSSRLSSPAPDASRPSQKLETFSPPQSPKPIPVFRSLTNKSGIMSGSNMNSNQRVVSLKSKKAKRLHHFGLKLGNYMEKDSSQPTTEKITVEQFAKCLNLVRTNDASLKRHQEKLRQSESRWRMPVGDRPLRLRRIRGDRMHMPASDSYRASRRVGLQ